MENIQQNLTATVCENMELYGAKAPEYGEKDTREEIPEQHIVDFFVETMHSIKDTLENTIGENLVDVFLWNMVNVVHRVCWEVDRIEDRLDRQLRDMLKTLDGSEVKEYQFDCLKTEIGNIREKQQQMDSIRDTLKAAYYSLVGEAWTPIKGNVYSKSKALTGSTLFAEQLRREKLLTRQQRACIGDIFVFAACGQYTEQQIFKIYPCLDKIFTKYPTMTLVTFGNTKLAADKTVHNWAESKGVSVIMYRPDFQLGKQAPFKRNDKILDDFKDSLKGIICLGSGGILANLRQKAQDIKVLNL